MKIYQKGFVAPILAIAAVVIIGGIAYYLYKTGPNNNGTNLELANQTVKSQNSESQNIVILKDKKAVKTD